MQDAPEHRARQPAAPAARRVSTAKQLTTGARAAQTAKKSGGKIVLIGDAMAEVAGLGSRERFKGRLEQTVKTRELRCCGEAIRKFFSSPPQSDNKAHYVDFKSHGRHLRLI